MNNLFLQFFSLILLVLAHAFGVSGTIHYHKACKLLRTTTNKEVILNALEFNTIAERKFFIFNVFSFIVAINCFFLGFKTSTSIAFYIGALNLIGIILNLYNIKGLYKTIVNMLIEK